MPEEEEHSLHWKLASEVEQVVLLEDWEVVVVVVPGAVHQVVSELVELKTFDGVRLTA